jgi:hypothetical protein
MTNRKARSQSSRTQTATRPRSGNGPAWLIVAVVVIGGLLVFGVGLWLGRARANQSAAGPGSPPIAAANPAVGSGLPTQQLRDLSQLPPGKVEHVEVAYFHRTQRCASCIEAERLTRKTLDTYFADRLKSGGMSLVVADVQKPQNAALARKYEASSSSLYLGILKGGVEYILPVNDVWLVLQNEAKFMATLRDKINLVYGGG